MKIDRSFPNIAIPTVLILTTTLLFSCLLITTTASTFLTVQPILNHTLRFYGHFNCTSGGELDCSNSLGLIHVSQRADKIGSLIYSTLNISAFDAFTDHIKPYTRWSFPQFANNTAGQSKGSIFTQFPLKLSHTPTFYPQGGIFGDLTLHYQKDPTKELPWTIGDSSVSSLQTLVAAPLLNTSHFELTFGDLTLAANIPYQHYPTYTSILGHDLAKKDWTFNFTIDDSIHVDEKDNVRFGKVIGLPTFVIDLPYTPTPTPPDHFNINNVDNDNNNIISLDNINDLDYSYNNNQTKQDNKQSHSTTSITHSDTTTIATIPSFRVDLTGPIEFFLTNSKSINTPCTIETYFFDEAIQNVTLENTYNWTASLQLPPGWPDNTSSHISNLNTKTNIDEQIHIYTSLNLYPSEDSTKTSLLRGNDMKNMTNIQTTEYIEITPLTRSIQIDCTSIGTLNVASLFNFHDQTVKKLKTPPYVEAIPTYSNIQFNITQFIVANQDNISNNLNKKDAIPKTSMLSLPNNHKLYMIPLDIYDGTDDSTDISSILIPLVMIFFAFSFFLLIITFLRSTYGTCKSIVLPQDLISKWCCKSNRSDQYDNNDSNNNYYNDYYDQYYHGNHNDPNNPNFDGNTSRNTDLADVMNHDSLLNSETIPRGTSSSSSSNNVLLKATTSNYTPGEIAHGYVLRTNTNFTHQPINNHRQSNRQYGSFQTTLGKNNQ